MDSRGSYSHPGLEAGSRGPRNDEQGSEASGLGRSRTYPEGTKTVIHNGRTYHVDNNGDVLGTDIPRRGSEPPLRTTSLEPPTHQLSRLGIGKSDQTGQNLPGDKHIPPAVVSHSQPASYIPSGRRPDARPKPSLSTVNENKKLNFVRIKAGTEYQDNLLDSRKELVLREKLPAYRTIGYVERTGKENKEFFRTGRVSIPNSSIFGRLIPNPLSGFGNALA
jgi:hypothetical protein